METQIVHTLSLSCTSSPHVPRPSRSSRTLKSPVHRRRGRPSHQHLPAGNYRTRFQPQLILHSKTRLLQIAISSPAMRPCSRPILVENAACVGGVMKPPSSLQARCGHSQSPSSSSSSPGSSQSPPSRCSPPSPAPSRSSPPRPTTVSQGTRA